MSIRLDIETVANWYWEDFNRDDLEGADLVIGHYKPGDYIGSCFLAWRKGGQWFVFTSSHCSCGGMAWGAGMAPMSATAMLLEARDTHRLNDAQRAEIRAIVGQEDPAAVIAELKARAMANEDVMPLLTSLPIEMQVAYDKAMEEG